MSEAIDDGKLKRIYLQVAEQIAASIRGGEIAPGSRLPAERNLAQQFEVSRPAIREALIALEVAGLVDIKSGSGVYVRTPAGPANTFSGDSGPGPLEILQARLHIEAEIAALAATNITTSQLQELEQLLEDMRTENDRNDITEQADEAFHRVIARASCNSAMESIAEWLWQQRRKTAVSQHFYQRLREAGIKPVVEDHTAIYLALAQGDPDLARRAMRQHLQRVIAVAMMDD